MSKATTTLRSLADLNKVLSIVESTSVVPKTPQEARALADQVFGKPANAKADVEQVEIVEEAVFITQMNAAVGDFNFKKAFALGSRHGASRSSRASFRFKTTLPALMTALQPVRAFSGLPEAGSKDHAFVVAHRAAIDERLSALNQQAVSRNTITRLENFDALSSRSNVVWPDAVQKAILLARAVPMVVSIISGFEFPKGVTHQPVAGKVFIVPMDIVGVPDRGSHRDDAAINAATRYADIHKIGSVTPLPMRRTESDGVWFAASPTPLAVEEINFLDRVKPTDHGRLDEAMRTLAIRKQRDRRLAFEAEHADLYEAVRANKALLSDLEDQRDVMREQFVGFTGMLPSASDRVIAKHTRALLDADLAGERDVVERVRSRLHWQAAMGKAMAIRDGYRAVSGNIKATKAKLAHYEHRIDTLKMETLRGIRHVAAPKQAMAA
jgi:hypothetical protein